MAAARDDALRIHHLDILRGLAIVGVLFMNINGMGANSSSGRYPETVAWALPDQIVWGMRQVLLAGTARCLLEMLFGAGMVVLATRALRKGTWVMAIRRYYARSLLLVVLGIFHLFALCWYADFLHIYGLAALIIFPLTRLRAGWLLSLGLAYTVSFAVAGVVAQAPVPSAPIQLSRASGTMPDAVRATIRSDLASIASENVERTTTPARWVGALIDVYGAHFNWGWVRYGLCEAGATMLIGAGLFRLGVLQGARSRGFYLRLAVIGYLFGLAIRVPVAWFIGPVGPALPILDSLREAARLSMAIGHVATVALILGSVRWKAVLLPFAAAGRLSLSLYLSQTVLCLWLVFSPIGLGLYGQMDWLGLTAIAAVANAMLLVAANVWMRHYRIGPVEWAWRSLAGSQWLPFKRVRPLDRASAPN